MSDYIDNKEFFAKLKERKDEEKKSGEPQPISDYLGLCFLKIATNLSFRLLHSMSSSFLLFLNNIINI